MKPMLGQRQVAEPVVGVEAKIGEMARYGLEQTLQYAAVANWWDHHLQQNGGLVGAGVGY